MTKIDTKEIRDLASTAKTYVLHPVWYNRVLELCTAYDEAQNRISTLEALLSEVFREVIDSDKISFETFRSIQKELGER